jgi:DNA-directed RNA polymerase subunit RPC12/RpoP
MVVARNIRCSHCGAPVEFNPGDLMATCNYCGFTVLVETGKAYNFEHSLLLNKQSKDQIESSVMKWMSSGFLKPSDLDRKSKFLELDLVYLPFWLISVESKTNYEGIFERISPPVKKDGEIKKEYNWLVLAREAADFPTREYDVPLDGKIPYDFRKIEKFAKIINSEVVKEEAINIAKQEIEAHHRFLLLQNVDRIIETKSIHEIKQVIYLHSPVWFVKYQYKRKSFNLIVDGATGLVVKGDIPSTDL